MQTNDYSTTSWEDVHTPENPYCGDLACWCHSDTEYHDEIHTPEYSEEEEATAYDFFGIARKGR